MKTDSTITIKREVASDLYDEIEKSIFRLERIIEETNMEEYPLSCNSILDKIKNLKAGLDQLACCLTN